jgi:hypothetical protein
MYFDPSGPAPLDTSCTLRDLGVKNLSTLQVRASCLGAGPSEVTDDGTSFNFSLGPVSHIICKIALDLRVVQGPLNFLVNLDSLYLRLRKVCCNGAVHSSYLFTEYWVQFGNP